MPCTATYEHDDRSTTRWTTLVAVMCLVLMDASAQDLSRTRVLVEQRRWQEAGRSVDQMLSRSDMQGNAEAWYLKAKVCSALAIDSTGRTSGSGNGTQSLKAFGKALSIDREATEALLARDGYSPLYDLYSAAMRKGKRHYGNGRFAESAEAFEEAGRVGDYIHAQGWGMHALDTSLTLWKAMALDRSGDTRQALGLFTRLAEAGVGGKPEYALVYRWLAKHAHDAGDAQGFERHHRAGTERYPDDRYLRLIDLDRLLDEGDAERIIPAFDRLARDEPDSYDMAFHYANQLFDATHSFDRTSRNRDFGVFSPGDTAATYPESVYESKCDRIEALYGRCLVLKPGTPEPARRLGRHHYNEALVLDSLKRAQEWNGTNRRRLEERLTETKRKAVRRLEETLGRYDRGEWRPTDLEEYKSVLKMLAFCHMGFDGGKSDMYLSRLEDIEKGGKPPIKAAPTTSKGGRGS